MNNIVIMNDEQLNHIVSKLRDAVTTQTDNTPTTICYTNKEIADVLGVSDKLIKKYRDEGVLPFSVYGDKYWYTPQDIAVFLQNTHQKAFNSPN